MATRDTSAQFQEPPVAELPGPASASSIRSSIDAQFQEPISPPLTENSTTDVGAPLHKSTTEKLKDAVKKPFTSSTSSDSTVEAEMLGHMSITSPEMAAANQSLKAHDMKAL